jgi:hypothetical protein
MCLHPDITNCSGGIIDAHSIQNSRSLESISENGLVYKFELSFDTLSNWEKYRTIEPIKIGKANTSVFKGFCSYHDRELFKEIDMKDIIPTKEQSVLFSIRSLAKEIYTKNTVLNIKDISKELQTGDDPQLLAISQDIMNLSHEGNKLALEDLGKEYINFFRFYNKKDYSKLNRLIIKVDNIPEVLCSTCFAPEFDMNGHTLQNLITNDPLEYLTLDIIINDNRGIIQFCWHDNYNYCKLFADSLINNNDISNTIIKLIFGISENHAFRISWYDSLSILKKKGLINLAMFNISSLLEMSNNTQHIFNDKKKYVNWTIKEIIREY